MSGLTSKSEAKDIVSGSEKRIEGDVWRSGVDWQKKGGLKHYLLVPNQIAALSGRAVEDF